MNSSVEPKTRASMIGSTMRLPICCAALTSLTLEETMTLPSTLRMHASGATTPIIVAKFRFGNRRTPMFMYDQTSTTVT